MITYTLSNGNKILTWTVIGSAAKMDNALNEAGEQWYLAWFPTYDQNEVLIPWANLTLTQKKSILDQALKKIIKDTAGSKYINLTVDTSRDQALIEVVTRYETNDP